jgi:hypothetical protein
VPLWVQDVLCPYDRARRNVLKTLISVCCCFVVCCTCNELFMLLYFMGRPTDFSNWFYHFTAAASAENDAHRHVSLDRMLSFCEHWRLCNCSVDALRYTMLGALDSGLLGRESYHFTVLSVFSQCCFNPCIYALQYKEFHVGARRLKLIQRCSIFLTDTRVCVPNVD